MQPTAGPLRLACRRVLGEPATKDFRPATFRLFLRHRSLLLQAVPGKGRGVFAGKAIAAGRTVEVAPVVVMPAADRPHLDRTRLHDYIFEWADGCCMALGWVPLFNHSYNANCEYVMDYAAENITVLTVRDVAAGEELTINYNGDPDDPKPVWFEAG